MAMANVNSKTKGFPNPRPLLPSVHKINHSRFRNALSIDSNALPEIHEMRGGEQSNAKSSTLHHCRHHVTHGALAICASNMDKLEALFRVPNGRANPLGGSSSRPCRPQGLPVETSATA